MNIKKNIKVWKKMPMSWPITQSHDFLPFHTQNLPCLKTPIPCITENKILLFCHNRQFTYPTYSKTDQSLISFKDSICLSTIQNASCVWWHLLSVTSARAFIVGQTWPIISSFPPIWLLFSYFLPGFSPLQYVLVLSSFRFH